MKKTITIILLLFIFKLSSGQNEYVKQIDHPGLNIFSLSHSSFIKDKNFFTLSKYHNDSALERSNNLQKTDLLGNTQPTSLTSTSFNIEIKPSSAIHNININSYIKGIGATNYFIGYSAQKIVIGEVDDFGNFISVNYLVGATNSQTVINKMILSNGYLYAVGSYTNNYNTHAELAVFKFDLSFNVISSYTISSIFGLTQFDDEISEGLDLIIDQAGDLCIVGNIFESAGGSGVTTSIFGAPLQTNHNYGFFCKINTLTNAVIAFKIFGITATSLESLMFRRLIQVNNSYYVFGSFEHTISVFKPLILDLDITLGINSSTGFGDPNIRETITDVAYDSKNDFFYTVTRGFDLIAPPAPFFGIFANPLFMRNIKYQGSLYKIDSKRLNCLKRRQLLVSSPNTLVGFESICLSQPLITSNERLIITGMNNDNGTLNKNLWYLNTNIIDDDDNRNCSKNEPFDNYSPSVSSLIVSMQKNNLSYTGFSDNFDIIQLTEIDYCERPLKDNVALLQKNNRGSKIENIMLNKFEGYLAENFESTKASTISLKIFSTTGQLILELPELNYSYLNGLIEGIYLVQINLENNETHNIKLIVTK